MRGLKLLARVGPSPLDPWRYAMGWSEVAARNHARRLEREGWLERCPMVRAEGSLFFATRKGVMGLGVAHGSRSEAPRAAGTPQPSGVVGQLNWLDRHNFKRSGHRPVLVVQKETVRFAIEVELAAKSKSRLDAILKLHLHWIVSGKATAVVYICGDEQGASGSTGLSTGSASTPAAIACRSACSTPSRRRRSQPSRRLGREPSGERHD